MSGAGQPQPRTGTGTGGGAGAGRAAAAGDPGETRLAAAADATDDSAAAAGANDGEMLYRWPGGLFQVPDGGCRRIDPFVLRRGHTTVLRGASGSGKSSFLSQLVGLAEAHPTTTTTGTGTDTGAAAAAVFPPLGRHVYLPQFSSFPRALRVRSECLLGWAKLLEGLHEEELWEALPEAEVRAATGRPEGPVGHGLIRVSYLPRRFDELAGRFLGEAGDAGENGGAGGHVALAGRRLSQLSGGQLKRFALMRRLAFRPGILVLDEPDTGLDLEAARQLVAALTDPSLFPGAPPAVLLVTHHDHERLFEGATRRPEVVAIAEGDGEVAAGPGTDGRDPPAAEDAANQPQARRRAGGALRFFEPLNQLLGRARFECLHQVRLLCGDLQNLAVLAGAPLLVFGLLAATGEFPVDERGSTDLGGVPKFALFCVVAAVWLGTQLFAKFPVEAFRSVREDFWWAAGLRGGRRRALPLHLGALLAGLGLTVLLAGLLQGTIGAVVSYRTLLAGAEGTAGTFPFFWVVAVAASVFGGFLGLGIGGLVALAHLAPAGGLRRPRPPRMVWVNLLVPVFLLFQIVFTAPYLVGGRAERLFEPGRSGTRFALARVNPCTGLEAALESAYAESGRPARGLDGLVARGHLLFDARNLVPYAASLGLAAAAAAAGLALVLASKDMRRE